MVNKIFFQQLFGDRENLPISIEAASEEIFSRVITQVLRLMTKSNRGLLDGAFDISTLSADIPLDPGDFEKTVEEIQKKFGNAFCIRLGTSFKIA